MCPLSPRREYDHHFVIVSALCRFLLDASTSVAKTCYAEASIVTTCYTGTFIPGTFVAGTLVAGTFVEGASTAENFTAKTGGRNGSVSFD